MGKKPIGSKSEDKDAVNVAVAGLISAVENKGTLTLKHIWSIFWGTLSVTLVFQLAGLLFTLFSLGCTTGWFVHRASLALFPEPSQPATVTRIPMPVVLAAHTDFVSDKAADWMYPLVRTLEDSRGAGEPRDSSTAHSNSPDLPKEELRTAFQVSTTLTKSTNACRVQLIKSGTELAGFAFLVHQEGDGKSCYQPLARVRSTDRRFVVDVPDADAGDQIMFLTALPGTFKKSDLEGLFTIRRDP